MMRIPPSPPPGANSTGERWVSVDEVAAHVGVRKDSIYRWIESRGLPATKIGKLWKLKLSEVDAWMSAGGARADADEAAGPSVAAVGTPATQSHEVSILVVDDDADMRETLEDVLKEQGFSAMSASDGVEALKLLRSADSPRPDLILLDLGMPNLDGLGFLAEQKRDPNIADIPVIIITADRREVGATPVLPKPLNLNKVLDSVRKVVGR